MAAMRGAMESSVTTGKPGKRTSPLEYAVCACIAEDAELSHVYAGATAVSSEMTKAVCHKTTHSIRSAVKAISAAQKVSICFVLDTTGSMAGHIQGVKNQIGQIVTQIRSTGCKIAGLAFVGYKDWCDGADHFERLPFVSDVTALENFLSRIRPTGGGDFPEDVVGGLHNAVCLEWPQHGGTRVLFHIGDAPPHGRTGGGGQHYHNQGDDHPDGHPSDVPLNTLFQKIREKEIDYYFGKINGHCDDMLKIFARHYGRAIPQYDTSNPASIASSVSKSVMESVSTRSALAGDRRRDELPLDKSMPKWMMVPVASCTVMKLKLPASVKAIVDMESLEQTVTRSYLQVAPRPFDHGSCRLAFYGRQLFSAPRTNDSDSSVPSVVTDVPRGSPGFTASDEVVLKQFIKPPTDVKLDRSRYMVDLETQAVAAFLADCFNERLGRTSAASPIRLKFLMAKLARLKEDGGYRFMAMEKKFRGTEAMVKYTNNYSFVRASDSDEMNIRCALAVTFSHFTHEHTNGYCMVTDLQGIESSDVKGRDVMLLTDPAIHCPGVLRFGKTNMQQAGIDAFYKAHKCTKYCAALGLRMPSISLEK
ncbi:unnamed protein product [Polarella glacialis]|nr:unnamed protein product [Polarella glacialis]